MTLLVVAAVGVLVALAIGDALRSGRSSSAPSTAPTTTPAPTTDTAPPPPDSTPVREVARTPNTCGAFRIAPSGDYPLLVVEVVAGNVTCHDARRVMKAHYVGLLSGSWVCHGPEGRSACEKPFGGGGQSALRRRTRRPGMGDGADRQPLGSGLRFDKRGGCSGHMTQPLCERIACERAGQVKIPNCTPPTTAYRRSFGKARVEEIAIKGERVAARFSNGELITLVGVVGGDWLVHKFGGQASRWVFE